MERPGTALARVRLRERHCQPAVAHQNSICESDQAVGITRRSYVSHASNESMAPLVVSVIVNLRAFLVPRHRLGPKAAALG